jgi:hypothetical protein
MNTITIDTTKAKAIEALVASDYSKSLPDRKVMGFVWHNDNRLLVIDAPINDDEEWALAKTEFYIRKYGKVKYAQGVIAQEWFRVRRVLVEDGKAIFDHAGWLFLPKDPEKAHKRFEKNRARVANATDAVFSTTSTVFSL